MIFKPGQMIACINNDGNPLLELKRVYTTHSFAPRAFSGYNTGFGPHGVYLVEIGQGNCPFYAERFRPAVTGDIGIFRKLLREREKDEVR